MEAHGITAQVLPELLALRGVEQNVFHHLDVHDHTLAVLDQVVAIERDPVAAGFGEHAGAVAALLREPLADELTRGEAMRFAALLHDAAKPWTRIAPRPDGRGSASPATTARARRSPAPSCAACGPRRSSSTTSPRCACTTCGSGSSSTSGRSAGARCGATCRATEPRSAEVTVFTVADRLATRGRNAGPAIAAHLELARELLGPALERRGAGRAAAARARRRAGARARASRPARRWATCSPSSRRTATPARSRTREDALRRARELAGR